MPETDEQDGRDPEGLHLVAVEDGRVIATCRLVFVGGTVQFSRLAVEPGARRRGDRLAPARRRRLREPGGRGAAARPPRPDLRQGALRRPRLPRPRPAVPRGRDRARGHGEAPWLRSASTPDGAAHDRRRRPRLPAGRRARGHARPAAGPGEGPVRRGPRGPHAARGLGRAAGRRAARLPGLDRARRAQPLSRARPGGARAGPRRAARAVRAPSRRPASTR